MNINEIRMAGIRAAEDAVCRDLEANGLAHASEERLILKEDWNGLPAGSSFHNIREDGPNTWLVDWACMGVTHSDLVVPKKLCDRAVGELPPLERSVDQHAAQAGVDPRFAAAHYGHDLHHTGPDGGVVGVPLANGGFGVSVVAAGGELPVNDSSPMGSTFALDAGALDIVQASGVALQQACHAASANAGWWRNLKTGTDHIQECRQGTELGKALVGQKLMLVVSEVAEGMEGHRKGLMDDKLPHRSMLEVELADAVIRIADLAGALGLDLGGAIAEKLAFNAVRPDHKVEVRQQLGGKAY